MYLGIPFFYKTIMQNGDNQMHFPIILTHNMKLVHIVVSKSLVGSS